MPTTSIRQSGGSAIISLLRKLIATLGLEIGSSLELEIEDNRLILTPAMSETKLEDVLASGPKEAFTVTEEDAEWLHAPAVGHES